MLLALWTLFIFFMVTIIPLVTHEFQNLGNISVDNVMSKLESPVDDISRVLKRPVEVTIKAPNRIALKNFLFIIEKL